MIVHPFWKKNSTFLDLANYIKKGGIEFFLVGGVVRESVKKSGSQTGDYDLTTPLTPKEISKRLKGVKEITIVDQAQQFGTLKLFYKKHAYEITTFRKDIETDGRKAVVSFTKSMEEDAKRRDFTFNALYADLNGRIYDPTQKGVTDLLKGRVRFIGCPEKRIKEDYLRILRLFRFQSLYGCYSLPKSYEKILRVFAPKIKVLSKERRWQEFIKLLKTPRAYEMLLLMEKLGVLDNLFPKASGMPTMRFFFKKGFAKRFPFMPVVFLGISEKDLPLSKKEKSQYQNYVKFFELFSKSKKKATLLKAAGNLSQEEIKAFLILFFGNKITHLQRSRLLAITKSKNFPLTGKTIQEKLKIEPGVEIGRIINQTKEEWFKRLGFMSLKECLKYAKIIQ